MSEIRIVSLNQEDRSQLSYLIHKQFGTSDASITPTEPIHANSYFLSESTPEEAEEFVYGLNQKINNIGGTTNLVVFSISADISGQKGQLCFIRTSFINDFEIVRSILYSNLPSLKGN